MEFPYFEVEFTKDGDVFQPAQVDAAASGIVDPGLTDVFVIAHGWNNDLADARALYQRFFQAVSDVRGAGIIDLAGRAFAVVGVFWPSKKFTDEELIPGGGAVAAAPANTAAVLAMLEELKNDPVQLGQRSVDPARAAAIDRAKALVPRLEADENARRDFVTALRSVVDPAAAHPEDGSDAFFQMDPLTLFSELSDTVIAPAPAGPGGGASMGGGRGGEVAGGAVGLRDVFGGVVGAARRLANFVTYYQMKERAGAVGTRGVARLVKRLRQRRPDIKLHLIGHSFGGRVVTAAAAALDPQTPMVTMTLLQAAYSHNGLAAKFDGTNDGFFRRVVSERRISGPIVITYTKNDKAVGVAYPLASRIAHDKAAALGDANDPYGGMGRNGARKTAEVDTGARELLDLGRVHSGAYPFKVGAIYNLNADTFIGDHNDIARHEVAAALLATVAAI
jgi:esterase/lipase superfamily enzyme